MKLTISLFFLVSLICVLIYWLLESIQARKRNASINKLKALSLLLMLMACLNLYFFIGYATGFESLPQNGKNIFFKTIKYIRNRTNENIATYFATIIHMTGSIFFVWLWRLIKKQSNKSIKA